MANCTECISYIPGAPECGRGIKVGKLPQKTVCRKWLKHTTANYGGQRGERHYLQNVAGKMFDITEQVMRSAKEVKDDEPANG